MTVMPRPAMRFIQAAIVPFVVTITGIFFFGCSGNDSIESLKQKGEEAFLNQKYPQARTYFRKALAKAPSDRDALYFLGMASRRDFIYDSALTFLKRADLLYPGDREIYTQLLEVALAMQDWDIAISAIGGLIKTGDRPESRYAQLAELWGRNNHPANSYFYIKKALEVEPDNQNHYIQAANLAGIVDSVQAALAYNDSAIARFGSLDQFITSRALIYMSMKEYTKAEELYRNIFVKDSSLPYARLNLANCLGAQESKVKKQEALKLYTSILGKIGPEFKIDSLIIDLKTSLK